MEKITAANQEAPRESRGPSLKEVRAAQEGDPEALDAVLAFTLEYTRNILSASCSDADAQEIVSDVARRVFEGLPNFERRAQFSTWLNIVGRNAKKNYFKKTHRRHEHPTTGEVLEIVHSPQRQEPEQTIVREFYGQGLFAIVQKTLNEKEYEILSLRMIDNRTHPEIAEQLGITEAASKTRLHRVMQKLYHSSTLNKYLTPL